MERALTESSFEGGYAPTAHFGMIHIENKSTDSPVLIFVVVH